MVEKNGEKKQIFQIVCVVDDLDKTLANWKRLVEFDTASIKLGSRGRDDKSLYRGKEISCPIRFARFDLGGVDIKIVEPANKSGDPYSDCLREKGQGFHHIGLYAESQDALLEKYKMLQLAPVFEERDACGQYQLFDFDKRIGLSIALSGSMVGPCGERDAAGKTK